jgi:hypothetical protein
MLVTLYTWALAVVAASYFFMWWVFGIPGWESPSLSDPGLPIPQVRKMLLAYGTLTSVTVAIRFFSIRGARLATGVSSIVALTWVPLGSAAFIWWFLVVRKSEAKPVAAGRGSFNRNGQDGALRQGS